MCSNLQNLTWIYYTQNSMYKHARTACFENVQTTKEFRIFASRESKSKLLGVSNTCHGTFFNEWLAISMVILQLLRYSFKSSDSKSNMIWIYCLMFKLFWLSAGYQLRQGVGETLFNNFSKRVDRDTPSRQRSWRKPFSR